MGSWNTRGKSARRAPAFEPLEPRALLVGFYDGPSPTPVQLNLSGYVAATAIVRPSGGGHPETIKINTVAPILPLGLTSIRGTLRIAGGVERGTLLLDSGLSTLPLVLSGPASAPGTGAAAGTTLSFVFHGQGAVPGTLFSSQVELGSGTVAISLPADTGRVPIRLVFQPSSNGPLVMQL